MRDHQKTKAELLKEVESLRRRVAKLRQTEKVLYKNEEKFHSLVNNIPDVLWTTDSNGNTAFISPNVKKIYGYKPEDIYEQGDRLWFGRIHPDDVEKVKDAYKALYKKGIQFDTEYRIKRRDGKWIWLHDRSIVTYQKDGVMYADGIFSDITEQKKREKKLEDSEEKYRTLSGNIPALIYRAKADWSAEFFSHSDTTCCGYSVEDLKSGKIKWLDIVHPDDKQWVFEESSELARKPGTLIQEYRILADDGSVRWVEDHKTSTFTNEGKLVGVDGVVFDITERKFAEQSLQLRNTAVESSINGIAFVDMVGNLIYVNDSFLKLWGYSDEKQVLGKPAIGFWIDVDKAEEIRKIVSDQGSWTGELVAKGKDGSTFDVELSASLIKDENANPVCLMSSFVDVTERRKAEDALRESEERYRILVENQTDMVVKFDPEGVLLFVSPSYCKTFGKSQDDLIGKRFIPLIHEEDRARVSEVLNNVYKPPYTAYVEERALTKVGWRWQAWLNTAVLNNERKVEAIIGVGRDITERKMAEDALRESEKRFREIFDNTAVGVYRTTPDGKILMANPALVQMLGYSSFEELSQRNLEEEGFEPQYQRSTFKEEIEREGRIVGSESIWITKDEKKLYVLENARAVRDKDGKIRYYEGTAEDITKSKQAEEELDMYREKMAHAERLASLGTLSATLAHKLNQPLTTIRLSIENSLVELQKISCPSTVIEDIKDGLSAVSDVALTVDSFRNFARKSSKEIVGEVNLNSVAERILKLLKESARRAKVTLCLENIEKLPPILSNEKDLEQLFFALVENAIQAADGNESRRLIISGDVICECIELRFADDCGGIAQENLDKIFLPFFTTRPVSERTGLGLCIVEHIVSGAGGKVRVESDTGKGSTFFVTLPLDKEKRS
ncbi:MAG: PAS domain S-box protein [Phycisphaerae bacterium]|nr:PAS domain S-box protein [Phycisphaerae bacterium]NIP55763.1 PAS domain S-box protein [Phycisphaerae bacterium]NIS54411.1 PAS domain S-box protein [Phycisphaerae bacterium]NIU12042.1 PAS domain S-box protein [Phycisphaerae bacterium]NIU59897.1 PAS domain S-box protein [Phycisphaerae bacterium]